MHLLISSWLLLMLAIRIQIAASMVESRRTPGDTPRRDPRAYGTLGHPGSYGSTVTSLWTAATPFVSFAIMVARSTASCVGARPLSQTTPFSSVSTLMLVNVLRCFAANFDFTSVVISESLTKWCDPLDSISVSSARTGGMAVTLIASTLAIMRCLITHPPVYGCFRVQACTRERAETVGAGTHSVTAVSDGSARERFGMPYFWPPALSRVFL